MSHAILRRNSSKQGLQNLLKITTQRSVEDAEEVERERRRRARESFRSMGSSSTLGPGGPSLDNGALAEDGLYERDLKPSSSSPSMEEDEGFSDWTQRLERRRQQAQRMEELSQATEEQDQRPLNGAAKPPTPHTLSGSATPTTSTSRQQRHKAEVEDEEEKKWGRKESERKGREQEEEVVREEREREEEAEKQRQEQIRVLKKREEDQRSDAGEKVKEKRKEVKVSYTSKVVLHTEAKHGNVNGDTAGEKVTSYMVKTKLRAPRAVVQMAAAEAEEEAILETEAKLEKIRRSHAEKEIQELEQLKHKQAEAEQELEELKRRREERRQVRKEEERRSREEEQQRLAKEEEEKRRMKEDIERRRMEAAERMKSLSTSSVDGDEMFSSLSPKGSIYKEPACYANAVEAKITERTESLNRSLKKSNSFKKTQPPVLLAKIDDRLEQYTTAIEYSQEVKATKQGLTDIPMSPEPVSSKKNLFEAGEAWNQSLAKGTPPKDAESLKVGVADMITQWVKGNPDGTSRSSPSRPADVKAGDVMQKKNMWEIIGETSPGISGAVAKGNASGKKYKFVMTAHGKYEKIPVDDDDDDDENMDEYTNGKADLYHGEY
ncbi:non-muscle caldesmon isoform X2 [Oncorhynchus tshawytscha]|uniref:Non-muscle caldesmon-like n=1 Tax=Oncorhynchus tshawytscha TaxID=74940 RepID=A0AAZ3PXF0_ONCTS|nr:non-muscle caldesmon isoform X2 [Oncorhynchus tshawytscha]